MQYVSSAERFAMDKGREEGRKEEAIRLLTRLLSHQFGAIPAPIQSRLQTLTIAQLEPLVDAALTISSFAEFTEQLPAATEAP